VVLRRLDLEVASYRQPQNHVHRRLDGRATDLAVALRGVRVSEREESALSADGKKERGTRAQMFRVHVAPEPGRREDRMLARLRGGDADRPRERPVWQGDPVGKAHGGGPRIDFRDTEPRVWIFVGEEPEIRNDRGPAPLRRPEFEQLHRKDVARPGTLDENRSADGVDVREVELRHILGT